MQSLYGLAQLIIQTRNQMAIIGWRAKIALNLCKSFIVMSLTKHNHQESSYTTATQASISKVIARYLAVQRGQNNKCFTFSGIRENRCSQLVRNWCRRVAEKLTGPRFQCPFQTDIGSFESGLQFEAPLFNCFSWNANKFVFF